MELRRPAAGARRRQRNLKEDYRDLRGGYDKLASIEIEAIGYDQTCTPASTRALGYSVAFIWLWEFYLCYCEGGFAGRVLGDVHMLLVKPACRRCVEVSTTLGREDINPLVAQHADQMNKR